MIDDLEQLYRSRRPEFCRAAAAIAGDRALGEDAVQEAFAKAVRRRRSFRGQGSLEAWVWQIVVNAARDAGRRARSEARLVDRSFQSNGSGPSLPFELLTDRQREVLFLHYYADLDYATIAEALGIRPGTRMGDMATEKGSGDRSPQPEGSRAHGVIEIQTPDGRERLWAAPTEQGGTWWWIDFANDPPVNGSQPGFGACDTVENMHTNTIATGLTWEEPHSALMTLFGRVDVQADRVVVQLADGSTRTLPVVEGAFLASVDKGARLAQVTAYDGDEQVATWEAPVG